MELAPRYCRSCGSRILVKNVCHNCNNDPLKGDNYCYDCGALTPDADHCLKCGAKYKKSLPVNPVLLGSIFIIIVAAAVYFVSRSEKPTIASRQENTSTVTPQIPVPNKQELPVTNDTIINNIVDTPTVTVTTPKPTDTTVTKTPPTDSSKTTATPGTFTSDEVRAYGARCSYFAKNHRSQVFFFIAGGTGYIKVNDKVYQLKRKHKGVDVAVFGGNEYEASIRIDGLSGSEKEWLASCTLNIKDLAQNLSVKHKVYSACIEL